MSSPLKVINSEHAPKPIGPYSQGIEGNGFLFLSGQIGIVPETGELVDGIVGQTRQVLKNIDEVLRSAGFSLSNVVKSTVFLRSIGDFPQFNEIYAEYFKSTRPARSTVEVSGLPRNALIEIEVVAHK